MGAKTVDKIKEEYLTAKELAEALRLENYRTIHNWRLAGEFTLGVEYIKIRGKLLFYWPAIIDRLHNTNQTATPKPKNVKRPAGCLINL